jgi:feruloyl esterase
VKPAPLSKQQRNKSLLLLFFRKEDSSFFEKKEAKKLCVLVLLLAGARAAGQTPCQGLGSARFDLLPGAPTNVVAAHAVPAAGAMPAYCAVDGYVNPADTFALWMPEAARWNGRYIVRGCSGSCGTVAIRPACSSHVRDGYACLTTDMGHRSTPGNLWAADNLQAQVDFGYRATHVTAIAGRAILGTFYGKAPQKSYFMGCSTGGRQALIEAERFPQDFDGIVAVAPADMAPFSGGTNEVPAIDDLNRGTDGKSILPSRKVPMLHRAVLAACDAKDGIADGLIADPPACRFDPASLLCNGGDRPDCLTAPQAAAAQRIYRQRGQALGSELAWIAHMHDDDPPPHPDRLASRGDPATIETLINPANPDLHPFQARGGKLIIAQGWADASVMPGPIIVYYRLATATMGGTASLHSVARLFMVPGMQHCTGGEGAYAIDYLSALEAWVERALPPEKLVGVHPKPGIAPDAFAVDLRLLKPADIAFSRAYFPYPLVARYAGHGDPADAANDVPADVLP